MLILFTFIFSITSQQTTASAKNENPCKISFQIEIEDWDEVHNILPKYAKFTVIDTETGKSFNVQRRAGSGHADVQPLTTKDTKIMKKIYGGHWSWKRRSILIVAHDRLIPASMHGMPHGAGALENGFPGHFCIHFSGSITHRTGNADISHHVMILKAAGKIDEYLNNLSSSKTLNVLFVFIKNNDKSLTKKVAITNQRNINKELNLLKNIVAMRWTMPEKIEADEDELVRKIPVDVNLFLKDTGPVNVNLRFTLVRSSPLSPWKVNIDPLLKIINNS